MDRLPKLNLRSYMKIFFCLIFLSLNSIHAEGYKSYEFILSDHARPDDSISMRKIRSDYEPSINKCFKLPLSSYNVTYRDREEKFKFKESVVCYSEENEKLPKNKKVDFGECKERASRNESYDLAYCYQGLFVKSHNYHGY